MELGAALSSCYFSLSSWGTFRNLTQTFPQHLLPSTQESRTAISRCRAPSNEAFPRRPNLQDGVRP